MPEYVASRPADMTDDEAREQICEFAGHEWAPMGAGMEICMVCEDERWEPTTTGSADV